MIRLFIALPVSENIKLRISDLVTELQKIRDLPKDIRFVPPANLHFTLAFLGYQPETAVALIKKSIATHKSYRIEFEKLTYGPLAKTPRMIWLTTTKETSEQLRSAKKALEDELESKGLKWRRELRPYQAHLTLARFREQSLKNLPKIERGIDWCYETKETHLMKSTLKKTGAEYEIL